MRGPEIEQTVLGGLPGHSRVHRPNTSGRPSLGIDGRDSYACVVKELVYGRLLLSAANRSADRVGYHDGAYHATFGEHLERVLRLASTCETQLGFAAAIASRWSRAMGTSTSSSITPASSAPASSTP